MSSNVQNKNLLGRSSQVVIGFSIVVGLVMLIETLVLLFGDKFPVLNTKLSLPIKTFAQLWVGVSSVYVGVDRGVFCYKSTKLKYGECDIGNPGRVRGIIILSGILMLESFIFNSICDFDYALEEYTIAFGVSCMLYVAGHKIIKGSTYKDGAHDISEEPNKKEDEKKEG